MKEKDNIQIITNEMITEYLYTRLILLGYSPRYEEVRDLASLMIDFLFEVGILIDINDLED